jgi:hypothetical protein
MVDEDSCHLMKSENHSTSTTKARHQGNDMSHLNNSNDLVPEYDRGIVPAEVAAWKQREGKNFGHLPHKSKQINSASIHTSDGYTVDREGLLNNYAVKPECISMSLEI